MIRPSWVWTGSFDFSVVYRPQSYALRQPANDLRAAWTRNATPDIHSALGTARRAINMGSPGTAVSQGGIFSRPPKRLWTRNQAGELPAEPVRCTLSVGHEVKTEIPVYMFEHLRGLYHALNLTTNWVAFTQIAVTLIGLFVGPLIAVKLAMKRFRSEKWWEIQSQKYNHLIDNLAIIKHYLDAKVEYYAHPDYACKPESTLKDQSFSAASAIATLAATGNHYLSNEASNSLRKCVGALSIDFGWGDEEAEAKQYLEAVDDCVGILTREARRARRI